MIVRRMYWTQRYFSLTNSLRIDLVSREGFLGESRNGGTGEAVFQERQWGKFQDSLQIFQYFFPNIPKLLHSIYSKHRK